MKPVNDTEKIKKVIKAREKDNRIVFNGDYGLMEMDIEDFVKQPLEGMLYDLNRLPEVIMAFIDDPKWINDYAAYLVIKKLKEFYDAHQDASKGLEDDSGSYDSLIPEEFADEFEGGFRVSDL